MTYDVSRPGSLPSAGIGAGFTVVIAGTNPDRQFHRAGRSLDSTQARLQPVLVPRWTRPLSSLEAFVTLLLSNGSRPGGRVDRRCGSPERLPVAQRRYAHGLPAASIGWAPGAASRPRTNGSTASAYANAAGEAVTSVVRIVSYGLAGRRLETFGWPFTAGGPAQQVATFAKPTTPAPWRW